MAASPPDRPAAGPFRPAAAPAGRAQRSGSSQVAGQGEGRARISRLDDAVVAGISAGEVVERPASVVKELVENSLDAGAGRIRVDYEDRERIGITVTDDGSGIDADEMDLAVTQHATSKLSALDDLDTVGTFGFRGEALASIAGVSELELTSATAGGDEAARMLVEAGVVRERGVGALSRGTRVEVRDLFRAVPARRKFLKSKTTEASLVAEAIRHFALANPDVHFRLARNGRATLDFPAVTSSATRVTQVLGKEAASGLLEVDAAFLSYRLTGFISPAGVSFGSARRLNLFVGSRWVRDRILFRSVMEGYHSYLLRGRYPAATLFLDADPGLVDVNVHPAKLEVRFSDPGDVRRFVAEAVRDTLRGAASPLGRWSADDLLIRDRGSGLRPSGGDGDAPTASRTSQDPSGTPPRDPASGSSDARSDGSDASPRIHESEPGNAGNPAGSGDAGGLGAASDVVSEDQLGFPIERSSDGPAGYVSSAFPEQETPVEPSQNSLEFGEGDREGRLGRLGVIGQIFDGYIVCQSDGRMVLVDQHAAHERMLYERLVEAHASRSIPVQQLLLTVRLDVGEAGVEAVEVHADALARLGWEIDPFGTEELIVRAVPAIAANAPIQNLAEALVNDLVELGTALTAEKLADRVLATVACHSAVRVGRAMDRAQARALLKEVATVDFHASCPHGRPVARSLDRVEIERLFGRV